MFTNAYLMEGQSYRVLIYLNLKSRIPPALKKDMTRRLQGITAEHAFLCDWHFQIWKQSGADDNYMAFGKEEET